MAMTLSMRKLWKSYRQTVVEAGVSKHEIALMCDAFYAGDRSVLMVLDHLKKNGETEELHQLIDRFGRRLDTIRTRDAPRVN
jgi:hypothetical protein